MNGKPVATLVGCSPRAGRVDLFVRTHNGEVWQKTIGEDPEPWQPHGSPGSGPGLTVSSSAPGEIDVVAADEYSKELWHKVFDGQGWSDWARLEPAGDQAPTASETRGGEFRVDPDLNLLHRPDGSKDWDDLGGYIEGGDAQVAVVTFGTDRIEVFAVWGGAALMRREYYGEWGQWEVVDVLEAAPGPLGVLRTDDLVSLIVRPSGLKQRAGTDGVPEWVAEGAQGRLVVDFPPQHVVETVLATGATSSQSRLAGVSSLHFVVTTQPIALSVKGILGAMSRLPIAVVPRAQGQASTLELPWRLLLALQDEAKCIHRIQPAPSSTGTTEVWHTRVLGPDGAYAAVHPFGSLPLETSFANQTPLGERVKDIGEEGRRNPDTPVAVERLILSSYGAWFSGHVNWPNLGWTQRVAMARDYYVRVVVRGVLYPFGHRAMIADLVERHFDTTPPGLAGLRGIRTLVVTEPSRPYGVGAPHQRAFPFQRIDIEPRLVTPLDRGPAGATAYWPKRDGQPVMFSIRGWAAGEVMDMQLPLLFSEGTVSAEELDQIFAQGVHGVDDPGARPTAAVGRFMALAMKDAQTALEGARQQVQSLTFGATATGSGSEFHPKITELAVELPAVNQLLGPSAPIVASLSSELLQSPAGAEPDVLLDFAPRGLDFAAAKAGVVAAPNMDVNQISRSLGPMVADLPVNPAEMFGADAKLLGVIPLSAVIPRVTGRPTITWEPGPPPGAVMHWEEALKNTLGPFKPNEGCKIVLDVQSTVGVDLKPKMITDGKVVEFTVAIPTASVNMVELVFTELRFHVETGGLPVIKFDIKKAGLGDKLSFVKTLGEYLGKVGNSGPIIDVSLTEIKVGYAIAIPTPLGMGVFTLQNLLLQAGITLSLANRPVTFDFSFGTRAAPFLVTVMAFGGGGYLELGISAGGEDGGLVRFVGGIEFGASIAMSFGVAAGEVHVFGGIVFVKERSSIEITGYLRIGGMVQVLGLITVSVELTLSLTYKLPPVNKLVGEAKLVITVDLTLWSTSVELTCRKEFDGPELLAEQAGALPVAPVGSTVEESLGPVGSSFPWHTYCRAFAAE